MRNFLRPKSVQPADSLEPPISQDFKVIVSHNVVNVRPLGTESVDIDIRYESLDVPSWLTALRQAEQIIGDGRIVSLVFNAFLQVPSLSDMRELLPAVCHVRSLDIYPGTSDGRASKWENYGALPQFVRSFRDLKYLVAFVAKDFDWTLLDKNVFQNLRMLCIHAIGDDLPMKRAYRQMLAERILAFCADPHISCAGQNVTAWITGCDFGAEFIQQLTNTIKKSKLNIEVEVQVRNIAIIPVINGFVQAAKKNSGTYSVSLSGDCVTIKRVRGC